MNKQKLKIEIKIAFSTALLGLVLICLFNFVVFDVFRRFSFITATQMLLIMGIISLFEEIALVTLVLIGLKNKSNKLDKMLNKIIEYLPRGIIFYAIILICCVSIKKELIWSYEELKEVINIQWTIFGISITVFVFWHVFTSERWKNYILAEKAEGNNLFKNKKYYEQKENNNLELSSSLISVVFLTVNLILILIATGGVYLISQKNTTLLQTLLIISFYMCTNTILGLLLDIILPLFKQKKQLYNENKLSEYEQKEYVLLKTLPDKEIEFLETLFKLCDFDEESRREFIMKVYEMAKNSKKQEEKDKASEKNPEDKKSGEKQ